VRRTFTPEEELILLLCGTADRRQRTEPAIVALARRVDHETLAALMARQLLLPLLGTRLRELTSPTLPASFSAYLDLALATTRQRGLALEALDHRVREDLSRAGIRALPLKGVALGRALYGGPSLRPTKDIDLLVESEQLDRAAAVLAGRGYRRGVEDGRQGLHLALEHEQLPPIELHWRVHWYEDAFSRRMLGGSELGDGGLRAEPADELASVLLFFSRDGLAGLRLAADVAAWWDLHGSPGDQGLLDRVAAEAPDLRAALLAAAISLDRLVGVPAASLLSERSPSRRTRTATRLANWTVTGAVDQVSANITLVDGLLSPAGGGGEFVRRALLPPASRIDSMYRLPRGARGRRTFWRLAHVPKLLLRYTFALWQVRGGRSWMPLPASAGKAERA
jgi:hypothetical protein